MANTRACLDNFQVTQPGGAAANAGPPLFVSIVICTHNRSRDLEKYAFHSLQHVAYPHFEIVVVDDNSIDDTEAVVQKYRQVFPSLKYVKNQKHRSLCFVRNLGVEHAEGEIIAFIDDDCFVEEDWLGQLVHVYESDREVMIVTGKVFRGTSDEEQRPPVGCNMSFRSQVFDRFRFDTNLKYSHWFDEVDLLDRLDRNGMNQAHASQAIVRHYVSESPFRPNKVGRSLNAIYFFAKRHSLLHYFGALMFFTRCALARGENQRSWIGGHFSRLGIPRLRAAFAQEPGGRAVWARILWVYYVILFEIPWNASWQARRERRDVGA